MMIDVLMEKKECAKADPAKRSAFRINEFQSQDIVLVIFKKSFVVPTGGAKDSRRADRFEGSPASGAVLRMALRSIAQQVY